MAAFPVMQGQNTAALVGGLAHLWRALKQVLCHHALECVEANKLGIGYAMPN